MQQVIEGLTKPLDDEDLAGRVVRPLDAARCSTPDTEENLQRLFLEERWTRLPARSSCRPRSASRRCWPARAARATRSSGGCGRRRSASSGSTRSRRSPSTPSWPAPGPSTCRSSSRWPRAASPARSSSTTSFATIAIVNGPIRDEIGMNSGIGAMGPYNHANATIGRAYGLLLAEPPGRLGPGRDLHGLAGQLLRLQRGASPRTRSAARGSRSTSSTASSRTRSTVSLFLGGWYTQFGTVRDDTWEERFRGQLRGLRPVHRADRRARPARRARARRVRLRHEARSCRVAGRELAAARRASTGTTSGCRRSCARGRCWARSRSPAT